MLTEDKPIFVYRLKRKTPMPTRPVKVGDKIYRSTKEASIDLKVSITTVINRIKRRVPVDGNLYTYAKKVS